MSLSQTLIQVRNRIDYLRRKYAIPLAIARLHPIAEEFCDQWAVERANAGSSSPAPAPEPGSLPVSQPFIQRLVARGFRLNTFTDLHRYLERCQKSNTCPNPLSIIQSLYPQCGPNGPLANFVRSW